MAGVFYSRKMLQNGEICRQRSLGSWNLEMNFNCSQSRSSHRNLRICGMQKRISDKCLCYADSSIVKDSFLWSVKGLHSSCIAALLHCLESYVQVVKYATSFTWMMGLESRLAFQRKGPYLLNQQALCGVGGMEICHPLQTKPISIYIVGFVSMQLQFPPIIK